MKMAAYYLDVNRKNLTVETVEGETYVTVGPPTGQAICHVDPLHQWPDEYREHFARAIVAALEG